MPLPLLTSRRPAEAAAARRRGTRAVLLLAVAVAVCCLLAYRSLPSAVWPRSPVEPASAASSREATAHRGKEECCTGVEGLELWGDAVKWGTDHHVGSAAECCAACKAMCPRGAGKCQCDMWVFCSDKERCKDRFGECWLKKQKDVIAPAVAAKGEHVMWTSGLLFGKGEVSSVRESWAWKQITAHFTSKLNDSSEPDPTWKISGTSAGPTRDA